MLAKLITVFKIPELRVNFVGSTVVDHSGCFIQQIWKQVEQQQA